MTVYAILCISSVVMFGVVVAILIVRKHGRQAIVSKRIAASRNAGAAGISVRDGQQPINADAVSRHLGNARQRKTVNGKGEP